MKLNSILYFELCKGYNVSLSQNYSNVMLENEDGSVHEFRDEDIDKIFHCIDKEVNS